MDPATGSSVGAPYFSYWTIFTLALLGGVLGTLMMVPLRRSLIVKEHKNLPYPEGTACASVLIAGEKGGELARIAYQGLGFAFVYAILQKVIKLIAETPGLGIEPDQQVLPLGHRQRRRHPRIHGRRLHHRARASPGCWWPAACWPGWGSSRCWPPWSSRR